MVLKLIRLSQYVPLLIQEKTVTQNQTSQSQGSLVQFAGYMDEQLIKQTEVDQYDITSKFVYCYIPN